jgi:hypothetical protein
MKDRRIGRSLVELFDAGQAFLVELVRGEAADHPHPLRRRRHRHLALQHRHRIGQRAHPVPAQFHIEVEPAANDVQVIVDEARQHAPALEVDDPGLLAGALHDLIVAADRAELPVGDRDRGGAWIGAVECREQAAMKDEIGVCGHGSLPCYADAGWPNAAVAAAPPCRRSLAGCCARVALRAMKFSKIVCHGVVLCPLGSDGAGFKAVLMRTLSQRDRAFNEHDGGRIQVRLACSSGAASPGRRC